MAENRALAFDPIVAAQERWRERWGEQSRHRTMAAATSIMRVQQLLLARFDAIAAAQGLTFARYEALVLLAFSRHQEMSMSRIGQRLMVHPTSATNIVKRLVASGYVERRPNPRDGRGYLARVTASGLAAMEAVTTELEAIDFGLGDFSDAQVDRLRDLLHAVRISEGDVPSDEARI